MTNTINEITINLEILKRFESSGGAIMPLKSGIHYKLPALKGWKKTQPGDYDIDDIIKGVISGCGVGICLQPDQLVIDVDPRNGGDESFERLQDNLGVKLTKTVTTGGGGSHYYYSLPGGFSINKKVFGLDGLPYDGIDFLTARDNVVIPPTKGYELLAEPGVDSLFLEAPEELLEHIGKAAKARASKSSDNKDKRTHMQFMGDIQQCKRIIEEYPNEDWDWHLWFENVTAIHYTFRGSDEGLEQALKMSMKSNKFRPGDEEILGVKYRSLGNYDGAPITFNTLRKNFQNYKDKQAQATAAEFHAEVNSEIEANKVTLTDLDGNNTVHSPTNSIRKPSGKNPKEDLMHTYVYCNRDYGFFYKIHGKKPGDRSYVSNFDVMHRKDFPVIKIPGLPTGDDEGQPHNKVVDKGLVRIVEGDEFHPQMPTPVFTNPDGVKVFNTFNPNKMPACVLDTSGPADYDVNDLALVVFISEVLGKDVAVHVHDSITSILKFPGRKIRWFTNIVGPQGVGKSAIANFIKHAVGETHYYSAGPDDTNSAFTEWLRRKIFIKFEEFSISSEKQNNEMKRMVDDDLLGVTVKGQDSESVPNVVNFMAFTNGSRSVPVTERKRIHLVKCIRDENYFLETEGFGKEFYKRLERATTSDKTKEFRDTLHYYMNREISKDFNYYRAPYSSYWDELENSVIEGKPGLSIIRELLDKASEKASNNESLDKSNSDFYDWNCIVIHHLLKDATNAQVTESGGSERITQDMIIKYLGDGSLGQMYSPKHIVKLPDGKRRNVWTVQTNPRG